MRTYTSSNITVTYPDVTSYLKDNLTLAVEGTFGNQKVGAEITVTNAATGMSRTLRYLSDMNRLVFPLNDTFMSLAGEGSITHNVTVTLYDGGTVVGSFGFDTDIVNGQTLPLRRHGSTRTVYAYSTDDIRKVQLLFPASGAVSVGGCSFIVPYEGILGLDLRGCITGNGDWSLCYNSQAKDSKAEHAPEAVEDTHGYISIVDVNHITPTAATAQLWFADTSGDIDPNADKGGGVWDDEKFYLDSYCVTIVYNEPCDTGFDFFKVRYTDTDGCIRYLGGKILEQTTARDAENYYRLDTDSVLRNISRRYINSSNGAVKIGYDSLRRDSYWTDILLSDKVEFLNYNGDWVECSVSSTKVTVKSEQSEDVTIEYELFKN